MSACFAIHGPGSGIDMKHPKPSDSAIPRTGWRLRRPGLRALLGFVLLAGLFVGTIARTRHQANSREVVEAKLEGLSVGLDDYRPAGIGRLHALLPTSIQLQICARMGTSIPSLFYAPSSASAIGVGEDDLPEVIQLLSQLGTLRKFVVPRGLKLADIGRIREALPGVEIVVDDRFRLGEFRVITTR